MGSTEIRHLDKYYFDTDRLVEIWVQILCRTIRSSGIFNPRLKSIAETFESQLSLPCILEIDVEVLTGGDKDTKELLSKAIDATKDVIKGFGDEISAEQLEVMFDKSGNYNRFIKFTRSVSTQDILRSIETFNRLTNHHYDTDLAPAFDDGLRTIYFRRLPD